MSRHPRSFAEIYDGDRQCALDRDAVYENVSARERIDISHSVEVRDHARCRNRSARRDRVVLVDLVTKKRE